MGGGVEPIEYQAVDLGLPSGLKWCDRNVGASSPEDAGLYFAWGDIVGYTADQVGTGEGQKAFRWTDYKWGVFNNSDKTNQGMIKYNPTDGLTVLEDSDDAARANMGSVWRMPTHVECQELLNNTTSKWVINYNESGINGRVFTSKKNSNSIFIPAVGYTYNNSTIIGNSTAGALWDASLNTGGTCSMAKGISFNKDNLIDSVLFDRCNALSVRGVFNKKE